MLFFESENASSSGSKFSGREKAATGKCCWAPVWRFSRLRPSATVGREGAASQPPSDTLWGHGSGVATCRRSISMSGMLVNQLHFAGGKFWVWLRRVAQFMKRMSIKRRLPLTVRTRHEEMPSGTLPPPEHSPKSCTTALHLCFDYDLPVKYLKSSLTFFFFFYFCASAK